MSGGGLFFRRGGSMWVMPQLSPTVHVPQVDSLVLAVPVPYNSSLLGFAGKGFHLRTGIIMDRGTLLKWNFFVIFRGN